MQCPSILECSKANEIARFQVTSGTNGPPCRETHQAHTNQSSDILQHSENRPTGDRQIKIKIRQSKRHFKISFECENEAVKHDLIEFKVKCIEVFC